MKHDLKGEAAVVAKAIEALPGMHVDTYVATARIGGASELIMSVYREDTDGVRSIGVLLFDPTTGAFRA